MNDKNNLRTMSAASRLWVAVTDVWPPFCVQMVVEGDGKIGLCDMEHAVELASNVNPGARFIRKGHLSMSKWIDSEITPPVREVDGSHWSGYNQEGAPFLMDFLDINRGPSSEVLLVRGKPERIIFRSHHAVMDARGTTTWAEDIFRVLRGEEPIGSDCRAIEDDLLNLSTAVEKPLPQRYIIPAERAVTGDGYVWRRKHIEGKFSNLLPHIMCLVAGEAWKYNEGKARIGVPVDLRSRRPGFRSTGNLTNAIFFNINQGTTPEELAADMKTRLKEKNDGITTWEDRIVKFIPLAILKKIISKECESSKRTGQYRYTAFVSNLGKIPPGLYSTEEYRTRSIFYIPQCNEWLPFFMTAQGNENGADILLTMPFCYGGHGKIDNLMENITEKLKKEGVPASA